MHFKQIKSALLIMLVFCTWFTMAAESGHKVYSAPGNIKFDRPIETNDQQGISVSFIFHQASDLVKPVKSSGTSQTLFDATHLISNGLDVSNFAYGKFDNHFKAFSKLLLFPFHGFW